ncbi:MAG: TRAP transporter substrate-binding protein [Rhodospirillales bacterium]
MKHPIKTLLAAALVAAVSGIGSADAATTLRFGHSNSPDSPKGKAAELFAELVTKYTNGNVVVKVFPSSQLGNNRKLFTAVKTSGIEMAITPFPLLADIVPQYTTYTAGYFYENWDQLKKIIDNPDLGGKWAKQLEEKSGLHVLGTYYYGARNLTTTKTKVTKPADLKGHKIRAVPNEMSLAVVTGLGGAPTPVALSEAFQAMRQGVVDGQENPLPTIWSQKFYEVQNFLMLTRHQMIPEPYLINDKAWKKLSAEDQAGVMKAAKEATEFNTAETIKFEASLIGDLKAKGMTVVGPEEIDLDAFRAAVRAEVEKRFDGPIWPKGTTQQVFDALK